MHADSVSYGDAAVAAALRESKEMALAMHRRAEKESGEGRRNGYEDGKDGGGIGKDPKKREGEGEGKERDSRGSHRVPRGSGSGSEFRLPDADCGRWSSRRLGFLLPGGSCLYCTHTVCCAGWIALTLNTLTDCNV